jgi:hypothetical protein
MNRKMIWGVGLVVGLIMHGCMAHAAESQTYLKQECKIKHGKNVCHVVKKEKISTDVQFLDMSEIEGKSDEFPVVQPKGKL